MRFLNSNSAALTLLCCCIYLFCLPLSFNLVFGDGFDSGSGILAQERQKRPPRPKPQQPQPMCNGPSRQASKRNFALKKRNYGDKGVLNLNIPLTVTYEGFFVGNLINTGLYDPVGFFTVQNLVRQNEKYDVKEFRVITGDSYILRLYRIIRREEGPNKGTPVFLQHGMFGNAKDWLMLEKAGSLAISCMEEGYDVWLGNTRGTDESRDHEYFLPDDDKYWDFSVDELGRYDIKAQIDKVLKESNKGQLFYAGHSLGTMVFYIFMHYHGKEYTGKIKGTVMIPPSAYLSNSETALLLLAPLAPIFAPLGVPLNIKLPPFTQLIHKVLPKLCSRNITDVNACDYLIYVLAGVTDKETDPLVIKRMLEHYPNSLSAKALVHLVQIASYDGFRMFDYGAARNVLLYNQPVPPSYNLFGIDVAALNIYGLQDLIVDRTDAERTVEAMGAFYGKTNLLIQEFNHIDLILSKNAAPTINARILKFLRIVDKGPDIDVCCGCKRGDPLPFTNPSICRKPPTQSSRPSIRRSFLLSHKNLSGSNLEN